jgi:hypothetical protein
VYEQVVLAGGSQNLFGSIARDPLRRFVPAGNDPRAVRKVDPFFHAFENFSEIMRIMCPVFHECFSSSCG